MALYKQPYGNKMEERAALRKEGIFAKIRAKRINKNTGTSYGDYVKEEYKQAPDKKSSVSVSAGFGSGSSDSKKYIANTGTGIDFSEVKNQGQGDFVTPVRPSDHSPQTDLTGAREGQEGMANIKDLTIQTGAAKGASAYINLLNKPVGTRYGGKKLSLGVEGSFSTAPGMKRLDPIFSSTLPNGIRVGSNPNIKRNVLTDDGTFSMPTNIVKTKAGITGQITSPDRDFGAYAKGSVGLQLDNTSADKSKPYFSGEVGANLYDKNRMLKNSGKLKNMPSVPNNFKITPSFGFNIAGNNFKTGDYGMNKNIISGASNYYANITAQKELGKRSSVAVGIGSSTAAGNQISFGYSYKLK